MGKVYDEITPELRDWLSGQRLFFVATAPLSGRGHINCSPKGGDTFSVLGPREVAYADLTGSGIETVAHLRENGRIVLMFCAFEGGPKIVRLHGRGGPKAVELLAHIDWFEREEDFEADRKAQHVRFGASARRRINIAAGSSPRSVTPSGRTTSSRDALGAAHAAGGQVNWAKRGALASVSSADPGRPQ